jgi:adenylate cyclase
VTESTNADDVVYSDIEFRRYRRHRAERLLRSGVGFLLAYALAWSTVALLRGDWPTLILQGVSIGGMAWVCFCLSRGRLGLAGHSYFCLVIPVVVGLVVLEGVSGPFSSMSHYHLLPLTVGAYLLFFEHSARGRRAYVGICLAVFVTVELGLVTLPPYGLPYDLAGQRNGRWLLFFANFASLMLVARRFVADFAEAEKQLAAANVRLEQLLENMLPPTVCQRLRREGHTFADAFGACSVLFADIVGYTSLSESVPNVVNLLDAIFSRFDDLTGQSGLEKIKTIGDAYMVAAGIPEPRPEVVPGRTGLGSEVRVSLSGGASRRFSFKASAMGGPCRT